MVTMHFAKKSLCSHILSFIGHLELEWLLPLNLFFLILLHLSMVEENHFDIARLTSLGWKEILFSPLQFVFMSAMLLVAPTSPATCNLLITVKRKFLHIIQSLEQRLFLLDIVWRMLLNTFQAGTIFCTDYINDALLLPSQDL